VLCFYVLQSHGAQCAEKEVRRNAVSTQMLLTVQDAANEQFSSQASDKSSVLYKFNVVIILNGI
jgi:glutamate 5-kinase